MQGNGVVIEREFCGLVILYDSFSLWLVRRTIWACWMFLYPARKYCCRNVDVEVCVYHINRVIWVIENTGTWQDSLRIKQKIKGSFWLKWVLVLIPLQRSLSVLPANISHFQHNDTPGSKQTTKQNANTSQAGRWTRSFCLLVLSSTRFHVTINQPPEWFTMTRESPTSNSDVDIGVYEVFKK